MRRTAACRARRASTRRPTTRCRANRVRRSRPRLQLRLASPNASAYVVRPCAEQLPLSWLDPACWAHGSERRTLHTVPSRYIQGHKRLFRVSVVRLADSEQRARKQFLRLVRLLGLTIILTVLSLQRRWVWRIVSHYLRWCADLSSLLHHALLPRCSVRQFAVQRVARLRAVLAVRGQLGAHADCEHQPHRLPLSERLWRRRAKLCAVPRSVSKRRRDQRDL